MPEIPDVSLYQHALNRFIVGRTIDALTVRSPFLVRTFEPEISAVVGHEVVGIQRMGKRIVWELDGDLFLVFHLMMTGRVRSTSWRCRQGRCTDESVSVV